MKSLTPGVTSVILLLSFAANVSSAAPLPPDLRERLKTSLEPLHAQYDPAERMLKSAFSSPGYHTKLTGGAVHRTRESVRYAAALMDTGEPDHRARALDILRRVISLQDRDPQSRTYGIWSWFLEEPLGAMSPPDWNWADFCGRELLQVKLHHAGELPRDLAQQLDQSIQHAARSIQRRNVGPGYTNIAILGTYVTLVTAETFDLPDLREYALARLKRFHDYTIEQGSFTEYNSPTYTMVSLKALAQLHADVKDPEAKRMVEVLYKLAWEEVATHFHPPTRQWAGPHSRAYSTLLRSNVLSFIQNATSRRVNFDVPDDTLDLESYRAPIDCPPEFEPMFTRLDSPRMLVKRFLKGEPPVVGRTYLHPSFTLGSINRGDLWNQRRALVAYWGTPERPSYLHVRFLRDGYDFAAAQFFSVQSDGNVTAAVNFATDGGNTHVSLDRLKDGKFTAKDLRLRFEFGGDARLDPATDKPADNRLPLRFPGNPGLSCVLQVPLARFGDLQGRWDITDTAADIVLYQGEQRDFDLAAIDSAALAFSVQFETDRAPAGGITPSIEGERLKLDGPGGRLSVPVKPDRVGALQRSVEFLP